MRWYLICKLIFENEKRNETEYNITVFYINFFLEKLNFENAKCSVVYFEPKKAFDNLVLSLYIFYSNCLEISFYHL